MPTKVAVISGGLGAVGQALALALAQEGYSIAILYRGEHDEDVAALKGSLGTDGQLAGAVTVEEFSVTGDFTATPIKK